MQQREAWRWTNHDLYCLGLTIEAQRERTGNLLSALVSSPDPGIRRLAADLLYLPPRFPRHEEFLKGLLRDTDAEVRSIATLALSHSGTVSDSSLLTELLSDPADEVRRVAAAGMLKAGIEPQITNTEEEAKWLARLVDQVVEMRQLSAKVLAQGGSSRSQEALMASLKDPDARVRSHAAEALGRIGDARAGEALMALLQDADGGVRESAAQSLGLLKYKRAIDALTACLRDSEPAVRRACTSALGLTGNPDAITAIYLNVPDGWSNLGTQIAALEKLGWKPQTSRDELYAMVAHGALGALRSEWNRFRPLVLAQATDISVNIIISAGIQEEIPLLINLLDTSGRVDIAETYLNCGKSELAIAARSWAQKHNYTILERKDGIAGPVWGSRR